MALGTAVIVSLQSVIYTYDGWNGMIYFGGEVRDPAREIPRAMGWGVVAILVVYLGLNAASLHTLGIAGLAGEKFPTAAAARVVLGGAAESVVNAVMGVSLLGAISALVMSSSRIPYAMATDALMPKGVLRVNAGGTPTVSLALSGLATVAFIASGTFEKVIAIASFFFVLKYCVSFSSVLRLRRTEPGLPRPYRALGYPIVTWLLLLGSLAFVIGSYYTDTANTLQATWVLVASAPIYIATRRLRSAKPG
jgi:APA family basic amino acid/polyamine antiporter